MLPHLFSLFTDRDKINFDPNTFDFTSDDGKKLKNRERLFINESWWTLMVSVAAREPVFNALEDLAKEFVERNLMGTVSSTRDISRFGRSRDLNRVRPIIGSSSSSSSGSSSSSSMVGSGDEGEDEEFFN